MNRYSGLFALLMSVALPIAAEIKATGYKVELLVKPSVFHGVHGLAFDANDQLYAGSVVGQSIYRVDTTTGKVATIVGSPEGMADDLVFLPDGTMVWTAINQDAVRARKGNGPIRVLAEKLVSVNSINYRKTDGRLFVAQVFGGDALWELDPTGVKPPRNILQDIGGLNGFDIGPDGWIYGPLWFKKQVVKINPDTGELKVVADGFHTPAAANFDSKWNLYVLDTALGTVTRVDIKSGAKQLVAQLDTSLDNLAIDSKDRMFVSNMADNGIQEVNVQNGRARSVVKGELAIPVGLAAVAAGKHDMIYVADIFAFRAVDSDTGRVIDLERSHAADVHIGYPVGVSANDRNIWVVSGGSVLQYGRNNKFIKEWRDLRASSAFEWNNELLIAQGGVLARVEAQGTVKPIASDLGNIQGLTANANGAYIADMDGGKVVQVNLQSGAKKVVVSGLQQPRSLAIENDGRLLTIEFGKRRIVAIDARNGSVTEVASNLPLGIHGNTPDLPVSLAVGATGTIYIASDVENSIYKLTKQND
jgi:sugar lactone lactonase YvrE